MNRLSDDPRVTLETPSCRASRRSVGLPNRPQCTVSPGSGWRVATLPERVYPGLVRGHNTASGYLLTGLTPDEWRVLDAFEDPVYELKRVDLVDGRHGWTYVCNPGAEVGPDDWSSEVFEAQHLPAYVERCTAWRRRYEANQEAS